MIQAPPEKITRAHLRSACLVVLAGCAGTGQRTTPNDPPASSSGAAIGSFRDRRQRLRASLTWAASSGATGYHVKRATTSGGPYTQIGAPTSTSYTDASLTNGTTYYYVVSALNSAGESANSTQVSAAPVASGAPVSIPATPTGLAATAGNAEVSLTWTASSGATSYHVKRATTSGGPYTQISAPTSTSYTDTSLANGTTYYYVVSALNSAGESAQHRTGQRQRPPHPCRQSRLPATPYRPVGEPRECGGEPYLDREQRRDQLPREARHEQRRPVHAGRRTDFDLLYRHLAHQRHDLLLRRLSA